ncbi:hypothetical protein MKW94_008908, partial [Papaver nudicaule]|nr:hypothetical protein [Papaver nudicaule]
LSTADYVYCTKQGDAYCPGKDCQAIVFASPLPGSNCTTCSERCQGDFNDAYRGSFCYISPQDHVNRYCLCCVHQMADDAAYIPPTMAPAPGELAPQTPPYVEPVAPPQSPPFVEPAAPPQAPPVFTINQDPAVSCDKGYTVSTPVDDCDVCNEKCKSGSFTDDLEGVFCYDISAGTPFCNCCVRYGAALIFGMVYVLIPTAPPMLTPPPIVPPVVMPTQPTVAPQTPPCGEPVTAQAPPVMSPHDEPSAAPETPDPHAKKQKDKKHRKISPISPDVKPVAPPHGI